MNIDVLAVMDLHISNMTLDRQQPQRAELAEARAAVAELIVAAQWVQRRARDYGMPTDGLDAAIASAGGAA